MRLLERGGSAADHGLTQAGEFQEIMLDVALKGMGLEQAKKRDRKETLRAVLCPVFKLAL